MNHHNNKRWTQRRPAFTLIEIMIVVLIIGILLAIAVPNFVRAREITRTKACTETLRKIQLAKEQWAMDNNRPATDTPPESDLWPINRSGYLAGVPRCPSGGAYTVNSVDQPPACDGDASHVID